MSEEQMGLNGDVYKNKSKKKVLLVSIGIIFAVACIGVIAWFITENQRLYMKAQDLFSQGNYIDAIIIFDELEDYKDAKDYINQAYYQIGMEKYTNESYIEASDYFSKTSYQDSKEMYNKCIYQYGKQCITNNDFDTAIQYLSSIDYNDSQYLASKYDALQTTRVFDNKLYFDVNLLETIVYANMLEYSLDYTLHYSGDFDGTSLIMVLSDDKPTDVGIYIDEFFTDEEGLTYCTSITIYTPEAMANTNSDAHLVSTLGLISTLTGESSNAPQLYGDMLFEATTTGTAKMTLNGVNFSAGSTTGRDLVFTVTTE